MATVKVKVPNEIESVYQFIDETAYRVVKDLSVEVLEISGKQRKCHRLVSINAGSKEGVINKFLDHDTDRPVSDSSGVGKSAQKDLPSQTTSTEDSSVKEKTFAQPLGRPKTEYPVENILKLSDDGKTTTEISKLTNIHRRTIDRIIAGQRSLV